MIAYKHFQGPPLPRVAIIYTRPQPKLRPVLIIIQVLLAVGI